MALFLNNEKNIYFVNNSKKFFNDVNSNKKIITINFQEKFLLVNIFKQIDEKKKVSTLNNCILYQFFLFNNNLLNNPLNNEILKSNNFLKNILKKKNSCRLSFNSRMKLFIDIKNNFNEVIFSFIKKLFFENKIEEFILETKDLKICIEDLDKFVNLFK